MFLFIEKKATKRPKTEGEARSQDRSPAGPSCKKRVLDKASRNPLGTVFLLTFPLVCAVSPKRGRRALDVQHVLLFTLLHACHILDSRLGVAVWKHGVRASLHLVQESRAERDGVHGQTPKF